MFILVAVAIATRSLVAPLVNLGAVAIAYLVSIRTVAAVGEQIGISVPAEVQPVVVALLFGVVTDYTLFFLSRFRVALRGGRRRRPPATRTTLRELLPILTGCGLAVAAGCAALLVAELGIPEGLRAGDRGVGADRAGGLGDVRPGGLRGARAAGALAARRARARDELEPDHARAPGRRARARWLVALGCTAAARARCPSGSWARSSATR